MIATKRPPKSWIAPMRRVSEAVHDVTICPKSVCRLRRLRRPPFAFLYFLTRGDDIVYIGATTDLNARLCCHKKRLAGLFDDVFYVKVNSRDMFTVEAELIRRVKPPLNRTHRGERGGVE